MYLPDINSLKTINPLPTPMEEFIVAGYYTSGDGGGGTFTWVDISITPPLLADDGGIIIQHNTDKSGYFKRLYSGPINVRWFGAKGDGVTDDTAAVHAARDSEAFANNGTIYFPKGVYCGLFDFTYLNSNRNEYSIVGDGQGTVLKGFWDTDPPSVPDIPVLRLGFREPNWAWAKVTDLTIDGTLNGYEKQLNGVKYDNSPASVAGTSGRWVFERVIFTKCGAGVHKPTGDIGNHYINCLWIKNEYGVYATDIGTMHNGCDRYDGCQFKFNGSCGAFYRATVPTLGQIIFDGTVFESNNKSGYDPNNPDPSKAGWALQFDFEETAYMSWNAITLRNVYFEYNGAGDIYCNRVRSLRIEDTRLQGNVELKESSVSLMNCYHTTGFGGDYMKVDDKSSIVAYEHRYGHYPNHKIFVNSISYDSSTDYDMETGTPNLWALTSVWTPLRAVKTIRPGNVIISELFNTTAETWDILGTSTTYTGWVAPFGVLGDKANTIVLDPGMEIWSKNVKGDISTEKYCVWCIHTYLMDNAEIEYSNDFYGEIVEKEGIMLGRIYLKKGQWTCSYGMKFIPDYGSATKTISLRFHNSTNKQVTFDIADFQVVQFDNFADANSFVNSREFAISPYPGE